MGVFRYLIAAVLCIFSYETTTAQLYINTARLGQIDAKKIGVGVALGGNLSSMDLGLSGHGMHYGLFGNISPFRFINLHLDLTKGTLNGGPVAVHDIENIKSASFTSSYTQFSGMVRVLPLRVIMWDKVHPIIERLSYMYLGIGYGNVLSRTTATPLSLDDFGAWGSRTANNGVMISEIGADILLIKRKYRKHDYYDTQIKDEIYLTFNYRFNRFNNDNVDGFNPTVASNRYNDVFSSYAIGIMYRF